MSTTPQFEIPADMRKMTEQTLEQVKKGIHGYLQFIQRAVPGDVMGGSELSNKRNSSVMPSATSRTLSSLPKDWCR